MFTHCCADLVWNLKRPPLRAGCGVPSLPRGTPGQGLPDHGRIVPTPVPPPHPHCSGVPSSPSRSPPVSPGGCRVAAGERPAARRAAGRPSPAARLGREGPPGQAGRWPSRGVRPGGAGAPGGWGFVITPQPTEKAGSDPRGPGPAVRRYNSTVPDRSEFQAAVTRSRLAAVTRSGLAAVTRSGLGLAAVTRGGLAAVTWSGLQARAGASHVRG
jgi:hypothetical protein